MEFELPANVDLGTKEYPIPISQAMMLPLATSEVTPDGLHITDDANGLDISQSYGESDITVTIRNNRTGDEETFRYVDGVLEVPEDTPVVETETPEAEAPVVEEFSKKDWFDENTDDSYRDDFENYLFDHLSREDQDKADEELSELAGDDFWNCLTKWVKKAGLTIKEIDKAVKENSAKSTVKNVKGFSKKTVPSKIKTFSRKANKYSMRQFSK